MLAVRLAYKYVVIAVTIAGVTFYARSQTNGSGQKIVNGAD